MKFDEINQLLEALNNYNYQKDQMRKEELTEDVLLDSETHSAAKIERAQYKARCIAFFKSSKYELGMNFLTLLNVIAIVYLQERETQPIDLM